MKALLEFIQAHKAAHQPPNGAAVPAGQGVGIYSVCSAHPLVIESALRQAQADGQHVLIEATSNQVNQFGGYTGMTPQDFHAFVARIAAALSFPMDRVLLGGDHLGPNCWQAEPAERAMERAERMIAAYVEAGFRKIHLDCSMSCAGDARPLPEMQIAQRAARLCQVAEQTWDRVGGEAPVYVVGTEVPVPGGAHETLDRLAVTTPAAAAATLDAHQRAFAGLGLQAAWPRVVALVVQPGVEFDHDKVIDYDAALARELSRSIESRDGMVFEAHSTDYQTPGALRDLVRDHFAILKVGPGLTFALRESLWALDSIAGELDLSPRVGLKDVALGAMRRNPAYWKAYYTRPEREALDLQYSLSDRIRYYWSEPEVARACAALLAQWQGKPLPLALLSQYLPLQYAAIREGRLANEARLIVLDGVAQVLRHYRQACAADAQPPQAPNGEPARGRRPG